ncbi:MAG TPA: alpha/beta hydrolase [Sporichthya sp.]|nr:alpha/beta hydrolase [Sporichthya sp.]
MPIADLNGNKVYYEITGEGPETLVFSHGAFLDHTMWQPVVEALAGEYRCITWDERGHGLTECNGPFDYYDLAADALGLLDLAGAERAVFVGMSQGGWLSQRAALTAPDKARGLVLVGTSLPLMSDEEVSGFTQLSQGWLGMGPVGPIADAVYGIQFAGTDYDGSRYRERWIGKAPSAWAEVWQTILQRRDDITGKVGEINCPVAVIHGTADVAFSLESAQAMAVAFPNTRGITVIEGGPHAIALTHPDQVVDALRGFMKSL